MEYSRFVRCTMSAGARHWTLISHRNPVHTFLRSWFLTSVWQLMWFRWLIAVVLRCAVSFPFPEGVRIFLNRCVHTSFGAKPGSCSTGITFCPGSKALNLAIWCWGWEWVECYATASSCALMERWLSTVTWRLYFMRRLESCCLVFVRTAPFYVQDPNEPRRMFRRTWSPSLVFISSALRVVRSLVHTRGTGTYLYV
jgi:hypothetical protein